MLSNRTFKSEIKMLHASTDTVIKDISFQQKQLRRKYSPQTSRKSAGYISPSLVRKDTRRRQHPQPQQQQQPQPQQHKTHQRAKSLTERPVMSESVQEPPRSLSGRETTSTGLLKVPDILLSQPTPSTLSSSNKNRRVSTPRSKPKPSIVCSYPAAVDVPIIVVDDVTESAESATPTETVQDEKCLNMPCEIPRCNSMPSVSNLNISRPSSASSVDTQTSGRVSRSSSITHLNQRSPQPLIRSRTDILIPQRRRSINISIDHLIRDLSNGIQHKELSGETDSTWTLEKQAEWDKLKSCRYLRFPKYVHNTNDDDL